MDSLSLMECVTKYVDWAQQQDPFRCRFWSKICIEKNPGDIAMVNNHELQ